MVHQGRAPSNSKEFARATARPKMPHSEAKGRASKIMEKDSARRSLERTGLSGKLHDDLLDQGEHCCPNRVARLARQAGIKAQVGYKRRPGKYGGKPSVVINNTLDRQFAVSEPDTSWVTDITDIRTHEGFAYLAVVIDLYSRRVVGWQMQCR